MDLAIIGTEMLTKKVDACSLNPHISGDASAIMRVREDIDRRSIG
jgi:hypothetical protein